MIQTILTRAALLSSLLFICQFSFGQQETIREPDLTRPTMFSQFSDSLTCRTGNVEPLFSKTIGEAVSVVLADGFPFEGKVVAKKVYADSRTSLVLRSTNYSGFTLTLFQQTNTEGVKVITGRLISFRHGDAFILQYKQGAGKWVKKGFYDLVNE